MQKLPSAETGVAFSQDLQARRPCGSQLTVIMLRWNASYTPSLSTFDLDLKRCTFWNRGGEEAFKGRLCICTGLVALGVWELRRRRREGGWDGDDPDDGYPHIRRGRVTQVMTDLGQEEVIV